jgi:hypothetical protein
MHSFQPKKFKTIDLHNIDYLINWIYILKGGIYARPTTATRLDPYIYFKELN